MAASPSMRSKSSSSPTHASVLGELFHPTERLLECQHGGSEGDASRRATRATSRPCGRRTQLGYCADQLLTRGFNCDSIEAKVRCRTRGGRSGFGVHPGDGVNRPRAHLWNAHVSRPPSGMARIRPPLQPQQHALSRVAYLLSGRQRVRDLRLLRCRPRVAEPLNIRKRSLARICVWVSVSLTVIFSGCQAPDEEQLDSSPQATLADPLEKCIEDAGYNLDELLPEPGNSLVTDSESYMVFDACLVATGLVPSSVASRSDLNARTAAAEDFVQCLRERGWSVPDPRQALIDDYLVPPQFTLPEDPAAEADMSHDVDQCAGAAGLNMTVGPNRSAEASEPPVSPSEGTHVHP